MLRKCGVYVIVFKKTLQKKATVNRTHELYRGNLFSFFKEDITLPNRIKAEMAMVRHPGSTGIVPLFDDGTVVMVSQYRHPVGDYLLEIPAGTMEHGESPLNCARRELEEEVGLDALTILALQNTWRYIWNEDTF